MPSGYRPDAVVLAAAQKSSPHQGGLTRLAILRMRWIPAFSGMTG